MAVVFVCFRRYFDKYNLLLVAVALQGWVRVCCYPRCVCT